MRLYEIAHARAGDKGDISNISLIPYRVEDYALLASHVTAECVRAHFSRSRAEGVGHVERYELPNISALNFVLYGALGGGVTRSLNLDLHGKTLSSLLLAMDIPELPQEQTSVLQNNVEKAGEGERHEKKEKGGQR